MAALSSPTLAQLRTTVRNLLNQPDATNSFWTDAEIDSYINEAIRIYFAELGNINEGHFGTVADLDIVSGVETVDLPSDFFMMKAVYRSVTDGYVLLSYINNLTESYTNLNSNVSDTYCPYYYFRGNKLVLRPIPGINATAGLRIEYVQMPSTLVSDSDVLSNQITPVFEQCLEMYAVYKAKTKESLVNGVDTAALAKANLADLTNQFRQIVALRSKNPTAVKPFNPENF